MKIEPQETTRARRVVLVDDSRTMQAILDDILTTRLGFQVVGVAADGAAAAGMIRELMPDLITIDLHMPYIDGRQLLESIRDVSNAHKVVVSSHARSSLEMRASLEALGADACIDKGDMSRDPEAFCRDLLTILARPKATPTPLRDPRLAHAPQAAGATAEASICAAGYPIPGDELRRLHALDKLHLANDDADHRLDLLTAHLMQTTSFSASIITFVHRQTAWIKSGQGAPRGQTSRDQAICSYAICGDEPLAVTDAQQDARFSHMDAVKSGTVRAYVGCPIIASNGVRLGVLCLLDSKPHRISAAELDNLRSITRIAAELIEPSVSRADRAA